MLNKSTSKIRMLGTKGKKKGKKYRKEAKMIKSPKP